MTDIERCAICGSMPIIRKKPLSRVCYDNYFDIHDRYIYSIECSENKCPLSNTVSEEDEYEYEEYIAKERLIKRWNKECNIVKNLIENNKSKQ